MAEHANPDGIGLDRVETSPESGDDTEGHSLGAAILITQLYGQRTGDRSPEPSRERSARRPGLVSRLRGVKRA